MQSEPGQRHRKGPGPPKKPVSGRDRSGCRPEEFLSISGVANAIGRHDFRFRSKIMVVSHQVV
ncbi:hypothetical protein ABID26_004756 [Mesorhizobium shonense]|uniref:Uncharacterized protein n=1 Tax=Mesorhizobium shonense TaxID=1209948 RepID=A0ABV2HY75_9HYPH